MNKVLIVEDSRSINELLTRNISEVLHVDVLSARTFKEAKQILATHSDQFFVAILDLNLPDAPNGEIVDFVLSKGIPPIILTGNISKDLHAKMIEKPIIDYVVKINFSEVAYVVDVVRRLQGNMGRKVLVVDDSKSSRQLLRALLKRYYFDVYEASDGKQALKIIDKHNDIILIVTDYNMPVMNGAEFITKVRKNYSRNEVAIIGISTAGSEMVSIKLLKSGANDFISRPFMHEEFYCRINQNIDSVVSYNALREAVNRDFLTGMYNRKYLFSAGETLFQNAKNNNSNLMVAMLDIDFFKKINDQHGHYIGDRVLQHLASMSSKLLHETDIITRIGGEEFCLLCMNIDAANSERLLEQYRKTIMDTPLLIDDLTVSITISIGYTTHITDSLEHMMKDADSALYKAKETGRNKVVYFGASET